MIEKPYPKQMEQLEQQQTNAESGEPSSLLDRTEGVALTRLLGANSDSIAAAWQTFASDFNKETDLATTIQQELQAELTQIWFGDFNEDLPEDSRFSDPDWETNPMFKRMRGAYVAWTRSLDRWLERSGLLGLNRQRAVFLLDAAKDIYCPVNSFFTPETINRAIETEGASLIKGVQQFLEDQTNNHGYPAIADRNAFELGKDVAATRGKVVYREELFELIQYNPSTTRVRTKPLLYIFSQVNRFYLGDLTPDRSLFKQMVDAGIQVFAVSWKNPTAEQRNWSLETYAEGVVQALSITRKITRARKVDLIGLCAGGLTATVAAGLLQAREKNWINSLSLFVSIIDNRPGDSDFSLFVTEESVAQQKQKVRAQGFASERDVLEMFAMLNLDDSIFSFMRSNYMRGEEPLAHPLLYWSMDYTRVPAEMQCDFIELGQSNQLATRQLRLGNEAIDLSRIEYPVYIMAGSTDHITPWHGCYRSVNLFGGEVQFVLTNQTHTQTISARPDNRHLKYWRYNQFPEDPEQWLEQAEETAGNWRNHWVRWLRSHSSLKDAPESLGNRKFPPMEDAPGLYVRE